MDVPKIDFRSTAFRPYNGAMNGATVSRNKLGVPLSTPLNAEDIRADDKAMENVRRSWRGLPPQKEAPTMKASEVIAQLQALMQETGTDPEVLAQSAGCCAHGHEIIQIEMGGADTPPGNYLRTNWPDEVGSIVIRV